MISSRSTRITERLRGVWRGRALLLKAVTFGAVGVINSAVDFAVFSLAFYTLAVPLLAANTMAWVVAVTGSYLMNTTITFAAESGRRLALDRYLGFALSQFAGFVVNTLTVWGLVELAHLPAWGGKLAAILVSFAVNFSLSHFVVFRTKKQRAE